MGGAYGTTPKWLRNDRKKLHAVQRNGRAHKRAAKLDRVRPCFLRDHRQTGTDTGLAIWRSTIYVYVYIRKREGSVMRGLSHLVAAALRIGKAGFTLSQKIILAPRLQSAWP